MTAEINDTYFFLYEQPDYRMLKLCAVPIQYRTATFSREIYEAARGMIFNSDDDAYLDWLNVGRTAGLTYSEGKNTYLKIVLKVKDEPELIIKWIEYHASIVGYHNLVVMNCGSTNPQFLAILHDYRERVLILDYDQYYDNLHFSPANVPLFSLLARNCKYLTILDADEFLFGYQDGDISRDNVARIVREGNQDVYAGTWIINYLPPADTPEGGIDFGAPITFALDDDSLRSGTFSGKSVVKSSVVFDVMHVGHNLHVNQVMRLMNADSFGKLFVFHLANLSPSLVRARSLKHLHAKGVVPREMPLAEVEFYLTQLRVEGNLSGGVAGYIDSFLAGANTMGASPLITVNLLSDTGTATEAHPELAAAVARFDFMGLLRESVEKCTITLRLP